MVRQRLLAVNALYGIPNVETAIFLPCVQQKSRATVPVHSTSKLVS
uniref:Uncharacterized protein n=1 Tax=Setaria viridis TaxID=4556 RepID=A0A4U6TJY2_SETVI|nr:hypothetical protein SEVIR_8G142950v2 [Setaria viridis]